jgi:hypothetical protein
MAGAPSSTLIPTADDPHVATVIYKLYDKSELLYRYAGVAFSTATHTPNAAKTLNSATNAKQEAINSYNKAQALQTAKAYTYPGDAIVSQLVADMGVLDNAMKTSAEWGTLIADANTVVNSMPAGNIKTA